MESKVQELAEKLYREGVEKGEKKAEELVAAARSRAEKELAEARAKAEAIIAEARREAEELKRNMEADIRLAGQQALSVVRQRLQDAVTAALVDEPVKAIFSDSNRVAELLKTVISKWDMTAAETPSLELVLPEQQRAQLEKALATEISSLLARGIRVTFSPSLRSGFQISRSGAGFKISLTDEDFAEFIKDFLRPRTREFLFGRQ